MESVPPETLGAESTPAYVTSGFAPTLHGASVPFGVASSQAGGTYVGHATREGQTQEFSSLPEVSDLIGQCFHSGQEIASMRIALQSSTDIICALQKTISELRDQRNATSNNLSGDLSALGYLEDSEHIDELEQNQKASENGGRRASKRLSRRSVTQEL